MDTAPPATLVRAGAQTLSEQLASRFAQRIEQRLLLPGARLPSVRGCAQAHGVSPSTVVAAYDLLLARGLVEAHRQRGFFVRERSATGPADEADAPPGARAFTRAQAQAARVAPVNAAGLIRSMLGAPGLRPSPGQGTLPSDWLDAEMLGAALRRVTAGERLAPLALSYGEPAGDARLRTALSQRLQDFGLQAAPRQILTTTGATQALDLACRTLLQPGDAVLVDEPGWTVEFARLALLGMRVLGVPRGPDGPDLQVMERMAREHAPKLYVTVSVLHNPTSGMLSPRSAHAVLGLAAQYGFRVLEDDIYAWLAPPHATRIAVLDGLQRTLVAGGFSKILAPAWRIGYLAVPEDLVDSLIDTKLMTMLTTPSPLEQAVAVCLEQGQLRRHAERVMQRLDAARHRVVALAQRAGCRFAAAPQGLFGWVDTGVDPERLAHAMLDRGWLVAPGHLFFSARRPSTLMRINYASSQDARFWKDLEAARDALA
jgi:DNA-binding transcriptional MocR family regulator